MVQNPSWEANWFAINQEIPRISRNPKVQSRTHKHPPPVSILGQPNPVHIPTSHLLEIHPNIHPSAPRSPQWSPSHRFPHQDPVHPPLLTHTRHIPSPSVFYQLLPKIQNTKRRICDFVSSSVAIISLGFTHFVQESFELLRRLGYNHFLPNPLQFIIHQSLCRVIWVTANFIKQTIHKRYNISSLMWYSLLFRMIR